MIFSLTILLALKNEIEPLQVLYGCNYVNRFGAALLLFIIYASNTRQDMIRSI